MMSILKNFNSVLLNAVGIRFNIDDTNASNEKDASFYNVAAESQTCDYQTNEHAFMHSPDHGNISSIKKKKSKIYHQEGLNGNTEKSNSDAIYKCQELQYKKAPELNDDQIGNKLKDRHTSIINHSMSGNINNRNENEDKLITHVKADHIDKPPDNQHTLNNKALDEINRSDTYEDQNLLNSIAHSKQCITIDNGSIETNLLDNQKVAALLMDIRNDMTLSFEIERLFFALFNAPTSNFEGIEMANTVCTLFYNISIQILEIMICATFRYTNAFSKWSAALQRENHKAFSSFTYYNIIQLETLLEARMHIMQMVSQNITSDVCLRACLHYIGKNAANLMIKYTKIYTQNMNINVKCIQARFLTTLALKRIGKAIEKLCTKVKNVHKKQYIDGYDTLFEKITDVANVINTASTGLIKRFY